MHQHFVQLAHAVAQRGQVHHSLAQTADFQLYVDSAGSAVVTGAKCSSEEHSAQVQVHPIRLGTAELPFEDEN